MSRTFPRRILAALLALTALAVATPVAEATKGHDGRSNVTVMTRNLYLGTDLLPIAFAPTPEEFEQRALAGFEQVKATDFPTRAKLIAREVRHTGPDLIGLQEAALWRTGPKDGPATPASDVAFDYLRILRRALRHVGLRYSVVRSTTEADIEASTSGDFDIRLTMRDAILARQRKGMRIVGSGGANFATRLDLPTQGGTFSSVRGYAFADVRLKGRRFRLIDTHLEAFNNAIRTAQAQELIAPGGPATVGGRVVLVGDLNSDPDGAGGSEPDAWLALTGFGLADTWQALFPGVPGYTCYTGAALMDPPVPSPFDHRIDHVLAKGDLVPVDARVVGTDPDRSRTPTGLWASDHGGVATRLKLK